MAVNEQTRLQRIQRALEALPKDAETHRVPWRGQISRMPVIRLELDSTVLNQRSLALDADGNPDPNAGVVDPALRACGARRLAFSPGSKSFGKA